MKTRLLALSAVIACGSAPSVLGFAQIARGELLLSTTARITYDSRVLGGVNEEDDYSFSLNPELRFNRDAGILKMNASLGTRINRYKEFKNLDSEDLHTDMKLELPGSKDRRISGSFSAGYDERTDVDYDVNRRLRSKSFNSRLNTNIVTGLKTSLALDGGYKKDRRNAFSDRDTWDTSASFNYANFLYSNNLMLNYRHVDTETSGENILRIPLNQELDTFSVALSRPLYSTVTGTVSYGYRILKRSAPEETVAPVDSEGVTFSASVNGPFLPESKFPKLDSSLSLSYSQSETPGINDTAGRRLQGNARISWRARERTSISLTARRAHDLTVQDLTVETTGFTASVKQEIGHFIEVSANGGYEFRKYRGMSRGDDVIHAGADATYRVTKTWSAGADYKYRAAESPVGEADYDRHVASVFASYTF